jgi:MFS family permease
MVIVNTVVYVKGELGLGDSEVALALAASGAGSIVVALVLPRLIERVPDRPIMLAGAGLLGLGLCLGLSAPGYVALLPIWFILGMGSSAVQTPTGRLLRRSAHSADRPALFAAQFALSHACWLLTYPLAGWLGAEIGLSTAFAALAMLVGIGIALALLLWPADDPAVLEHVHEDLSPDHPHLRGAAPTPTGRKHAHAYVIDEHHQHWPA